MRTIKTKILNILFGVVYETLENHYKMTQEKNCIHIGSGHYIAAKNLPLYSKLMSF